jgi:hypothetical protein
MRDDCQTTTTEAVAEATDTTLLENERWEEIESIARRELMSAQQRFDAIRALHRIYDGHGRPKLLIDAAEDLLDLYATPAISEGRA